MTGSANRRNESALIEHYFAPLSSPDASFGLSDDTAFLSVPADKQLVLTKDMLVADVHFLADDEPDLIARKALRVNLSDLAAKGAVPVGYLLGLGLPLNWTEDWLEQFCAGLKSDQQEFSFPLLGGDTVKSPERLTLSVTAFGMVDKHSLILRRNAKAGQNLYVTGTIGDSALGLKARRNDLPLGMPIAEADFLRDRFLLPQPRLQMGHILREFATASMDISDGLVGDATKMARAAGTKIIIEQPAIPLSKAAKSWLAKDSEAWKTVISGGDDYELLFTADPSSHDRIMQSAQALSTEITHIGTVTEGEGVELMDDHGTCVAFGGGTSYEHF